MFLKSLELTGFKSFAKRTVLQFEPGITAIVGPNGSGKSNIADALRWVLGAQSKKAVRGKVSTDVIFSGTSARPAQSLAEVSLTFDNASKRLPYDYDEVVVTRRLYRSGDSEYLVNGAKVRLLDLQHALAVAGIGAENYTVISQGMVDRVLTQTPRERRSLFEEAAGVRQFFLKRDEARRKLTETETNLGRVKDVLRELAPRLKSLRRQAEALAKRSDVEAKLRDARLSYFGHRYRDLAGQRREITLKHDETGKEFTTLGNELKRLTAEVDELRKSQQGLTLNKLLDRRNGLRDQREKLQDKLNEVTTAREVAKTTRERATAQLKQLKNRLAHLDQAEQSAGTEAVTVEGPAITALVAKLEALEQAITANAPAAKLSELAAAAVKQAKGLRQSGGSAGFQKERDVLTDQLEELESELRQTDSSIKESETEITGLTNDRKHVDTKLETLEQEIAAEQQKSFGEIDELTKREKILRDKQRTHDAYRTELSELNLELAKLETRLEDLVREAKTKLGNEFPPADDAELPSAELGTEEKVAKLEQRLLEMGGIDPEVTAEHQEVEERHTFLSAQVEDLTKARADLLKVIRDLEQKSRTLFTEAFDKINKEFGTYFEKLFGGGKAELKLVELKSADEDTDDDSESTAAKRDVEYGIEIQAVPPGKRLKSLAQLSGGERTLTSNALLFAILTVNPSPFVMLDEVDAALDEANTGRFANTVKDVSASTQFLVVTHNRDTMRAAAMLYGVSMDSTGVSTMLSLKLPEAEQVAGSKKVAA